MSVSEETQFNFVAPTAEIPKIPSIDSNNFYPLQISSCFQNV